MRFDELAESLRLIRAIVDALPDAADGELRAPLPDVAAFKLGLGLRRRLARARSSSRSKADRKGRSAAAIRTIRRGSNWPVLEHAVIGNIVPDFPLINKSFNLSYSGQDL